MAKCDTCLKDIDLGGEFYEVETRMGTIAMLCSPSCLVEFAWKLKEGQPKLSKSKYHCEDCRLDPGFHSGPSLT